MIIKFNLLLKNLISPLERSLASIKTRKKAMYNVITVTQHIAEFAGNNTFSPVLYIYPENGSG